MYGEGRGAPLPVAEDVEEAEGEGACGGLGVHCGADGDAAGLEDLDLDIGVCHCCGGVKCGGWGTGSGFESR